MFQKVFWITFKSYGNCCEKKFLKKLWENLYNYAFINFLSKLMKRKLKKKTFLKDKHFSLIIFKGFWLDSKEWVHFDLIKVTLYNSVNETLKDLKWP
jgi:hypothetical protein